MPVTKGTTWSIHLEKRSITRAELRSQAGCFYSHICWNICDLTTYQKEGYCSYFRCTEKSLWTVLTQCQHADCVITSANKRGETHSWHNITWHWYKTESIPHTCIFSSSCWTLSKGHNKTVPGGNFKHCMYQLFREFCLQKGRELDSKMWYRETVIKVTSLFTFLIRNSADIRILN